MAVSRLAVVFAGLLIGGSWDLINSRSASAEAPVSAVAPLQLKLKADRQYRDQGRNLTVAEGNVSVQLGASRLQADRVEFDSDFKTIHARGAVRLTRGAQTFQASALRYNIVQQEGSSTTSTDQDPRAIAPPGSWMPTSGRRNAPPRTMSALNPASCR